MSEARPRRRRARATGEDEDQEARLEAIRDATPDVEPPWTVKTTKRKKPQPTDG